MCVAKQPDHFFLVELLLGEEIKKCIICVLNLLSKVKRLPMKITESPFKAGAQEQN